MAADGQCRAVSASAVTGKLMRWKERGIQCELVVFEPGAHPIPIEKQVLSMTDLPKLDFSTLADLAKESAHISAVCKCSSVALASWESVPLSLVEANFQEVGTLLEDPFVEPTFVEFHPSGTRYESPDAPIAPRYFPYNRCIVAKCLTCGRYFLRYTEAGGYFVDRRIRSVLSELLVDAEL